MTFDESMMRLALRLAEKAAGRTRPNPMVGAVLVRDGVIIGRGWHHQAGLPHAEREAIASVKDESLLKGSTLYVTLEPCCTTGRTPPCTEAILENGIARVVAGCTDPNPKHAGKGLELLRNAGVQVETGVLEDECRKLNEPFFHLITTGRPLVLLKMACTLDGKTATASGDSKWVTGPEARARVQQLRKFADAILVGRRTFEKDNPSLTVRSRTGKVLRTPLRFVASSRKITLPEGWERADLRDGKAFLEELGRRDVMLLLAEGGGELAGSLLQQDLIDRIEFHYAPKLLGGRRSSTACDGPDPLKLASAFPVKELAFGKLGDGFFVSGRICHDRGS